ncbi:MAG: DNA primase [Gemmatimonadota bacterium]|nr:DNA primase [Gemmatimonadota bacterium]
MAGIPEHAIEEVRDRTDIVEVIGQFVELKKRGKNWVGLCPFHAEKTPSFNVTPEKQMYYCFGCQAGGNVFTFLMEHEKMEFPEAVRELAERAGVEIPEERTSGSDPHAPLYFANRLAADFYHRRLLESEDAAGARAYLEERGLGREAWETFLLGWAPDEWEALAEEARRQEIEPGEMVRSGLMARSEKTGGLYDRFRGRLIFPIRSTTGKVLGLSGRRLDDEEPKYLNSPDTPIFTKGRTLYNLDLARAPIRRAGAAILVEGNFDVLAVHGAGWRNVVAPLGTSFAAEQARVLKRYTATAYVAYDGDSAGERSAFKAGDLLLGAGFSVRIVRLPEGEDPDSLVAEGGAGAFRERLEESADVIEAKIGIVKERVDLGDVMKKRRAIRRLLESVAKVPDPMTRSLYLDKVSGELGVARGTLELPEPSRPGGERPVRRTESEEGRSRPPRGRFAGSGIRLPERQDERYLLLHAVTDVGWLEELVERCRPEYFTVEAYAGLFERLAELREERGGEAIETLRTSGDPEIQAVLARVEMLRGEMARGSEEEFELSDRTFRESLERILQRALERGVLESDVEPTGDPLVDALKRREARRRIAPGRFGARGGPRGERDEQV